MTVQEAKMQIQAIPSKIWEQLSPCDNEAMGIAIQALEEVEQYRALGTPKEIKIREVSSAQLGKAYLSNLTELREYQSLGTVEELKEAREKQIPKELISDISFFKCPSCGSDDVEFFYDTGGSEKNKFCPNCGQALKWGEEDD